MDAPYEPLFPYFGGKHAVADVIWSRFGRVRRYIEPFAGSAAVWFMLRQRDDVDCVLNDADCLLVNVYRALRANPYAVACHADWPASSCDMHARQLWLIGERERIADRLAGDPEWYDARAAGWWIWGASCWIGGQWCIPNGPWISRDGVLERGEPTSGIARRSISEGRRGVIRMPPEGMTALDWLTQWMRRVGDSLRGARLLNGDWRKALTEVWLDETPTAVFLDPPYSAAANRDTNIYAVESSDVAHAAREWAIAHGGRRSLRICLAGYDGEHDMPAGWSVYEWVAHGGMAHVGNGDTRGRENRHRERLWFSPYCLQPESGLFDAEALDKGETHELPTITE